MKILENNNELKRDLWVQEKLAEIKPKSHILDAGAGEQKYKSFCSHLIYKSHDFNQYDGQGNKIGLQKDNWDTKEIDIVSDICSIPLKDNSFDTILCTEVLEHLPDPKKGINELTRLLKSGGKLILTAPFASLVHFAPYHYCSGFSRYWYEYHLLEMYKIDEIVANGDWYDYLEQELMRLPFLSSNSVLGKSFAMLPFLTYKLWDFISFSKNTKIPKEICCFGYHVLATKY